MLINTFCSSFVSSQSSMCVQIIKSDISLMQCKTRNASILTIAVKRNYTPWYSQFKTCQNINLANIRLDESVLKTSFVFKRRLDQDEYIRLSHTSLRRFQDVFKTPCRNVSKTFRKRPKSGYNWRFPLLYFLEENLWSLFVLHNKRIQITFLSFRNFFINFTAF